MKDWDWDGLINSISFLALKCCWEMWTIDEKEQQKFPLNETGKINSPKSGGRELIFTKTKLKDAVENASQKKPLLDRHMERRADSRLVTKITFWCPSCSKELFEQPEGPWRKDMDQIDLWIDGVRTGRARTLEPCLSRIAKQWRKDTGKIRWDTNHPKADQARRSKQWRY